VERNGCKKRSPGSRKAERSGLPSDRAYGTWRRRFRDRRSAIRGSLPPRTARTVSTTDEQAAKLQRGNGWMAIQVRLELGENGIYLTQISNAFDAESVRNFFDELGVQASIACDPRDDSFKVSLPGLSLEQLIKLTAQSNLKLT
jgi:hypothetical protein